jgi:hypothetical protein
MPNQYNYHYFAEVKTHGYNNETMQVDGVLSSKVNPVSTMGDYQEVKRHILGLTGIQRPENEVSRRVQVKSLTFLSETPIE